MAWLIWTSIPVWIILQSVYTTTTTQKLSVMDTLHRLGDLTLRDIWGIIVHLPRGVYDHRYGSWRMAVGIGAVAVIQLGLIGRVKSMWSGEKGDEGVVVFKWDIPEVSNLGIVLNGPSYCMEGLGSHEPADHRGLC
jgi:hypothetical protein